MAPIDCTGCSSNIGRNRVPLSSDFQTPPLAAPTKSVILPDGSRVPAIAEMRPLIVAEPMLRAPRTEIEADVYGGSSARQSTVQRNSAADKTNFKECMSIDLELFRSRKMKFRVIYRHIGFDFIDNNSLFVRRSLASRVDLRRNEYAARFFVVPQICLHLFVRAVSHALRQNANIKEMIGIQIHKT